MYPEPSSFCLFMTKLEKFTLFIILIIMNKETYSIQSDFNEKKKRRPRSSVGERNYFCGCGKSYLSYPALYTHVKNKHDGTFPIGSNAKRKIPR